MKAFGRGKVWVGLLAATLTASTVNAAYVISVTDGAGMSMVDAMPGDTVPVVVQLTGTDQFDSFGFSLLATPPGLLRYGPTDYTLAPDRGTLFVTRGANDFSEVPVLGAPISDALYFTALTETGGTFWNNNGRFVTFDVTVDGDAPLGSVATLVPVVDFFSAGFDSVDVAAGTPLTINVVPEPATLALLGIGGLLMVRRRFVA